MSSFTKEEFLKYIQNLDFYELEDVAEFVNEYWLEYQKNPEDKDNKYQYSACMITFGHLFLEYTRSVIQLRKEYDDCQAVEH